MTKLDKLWLALLALLGVAWLGMLAWLAVGCTRVYVEPQPCAAAPADERPMVGPNATTASSGAGPDEDAGGEP